MHFEIGARLKPFSHAPKVKVLLVPTAFEITVTAEKLSIVDLSSHIHVGTLYLTTCGPIENWTVEHDLEMGYVVVFGKMPIGFFRYKIFPLQQKSAFLIEIEKGQLAIAKVEELKYELISANKHLIYIDQKPENEIYTFAISEKLSLGSHRAQDIAKIRDKRDLASLFPLWLRLGSFYNLKEEGFSTLLKECEEAILKKETLTILSKFKSLFLAGFSDILVPRQEDFEFQAIAQPVCIGSPLILLQQGASLIRSLFVQEKEGGLQLLPHLLKPFHAGRLLSTKTSKGELSLEWTKHKMRRMIFHSYQDQELKFIACNEEISCRFQVLQNPPQNYIMGSMLQLKADTTYYFDQFQK